MSLFSFVTRPVKTLTDAVFMPLKAVFVVGLCWAINAMTYAGHWWVKWVALGMGIATVVALARAAKLLLVLGLAWWIGAKLYRRYGPAARQQFDDWVARTRPDAGAMLAALRAPAPAPAAAGPAGAGTPPLH